MIRRTKEVFWDLVGDWKAEHLFTLRPARPIYAHYQQMMAECDTKIASLLKSFESRIDPGTQPLPPRTTSHFRAQRNEPNFDLRSEFYRILGADLTQIPGLQSTTASAFLSEVRRQCRTLRHPQALRFLARSLPG